MIRLITNIASITRGMIGIESEELFGSIQVSLVSKGAGGDWHFELFVPPVKPPKFHTVGLHGISSEILLGTPRIVLEDIPETIDIKMIGIWSKENFGKPEITIPEQIRLIKLRYEEDEVQLFLLAG